MSDSPEVALTWLAVVLAGIVGGMVVEWARSKWCEQCRKRRADERRNWFKWGIK